MWHLESIIEQTVACFSKETIELYNIDVVCANPKEQLDKILGNSSARSFGSKFPLTKFD